MTWMTPFSQVQPDVACDAKVAIKNGNGYILMSEGNVTIRLHLVVESIKEAIGDRRPP